MVAPYLANQRGSAARMSTYESRRDGQNVLSAIEHRRKSQAQAKSIASQTTPGAILRTSIWREPAVRFVRLHAQTKMSTICSRVSICMFFKCRRLTRTTLRPARASVYQSNKRKPGCQLSVRAFYFARACPEPASAWTEGEYLKRVYHEGRTNKHNIAIFAHRPPGSVPEGDSSVQSNVVSSLVPRKPSTGHSLHRSEYSTLFS